MSATDQSLQQSPDALIRVRSSAVLNGQPLTLLRGDCREVMKSLPDASVNCCVTSPPYWGLRDYGHAGQIGQEATPEEYVESLRDVFREIWRVLRDDGTVWINLGDSYCTRHARLDAQDAERAKNIRPATPHGLKPKDLVGIPWRVAFALQADGWWLRSDIIWAKQNCMPESVTDRPTRSHEYLFLLTKSERYHYDHEAIKEPCIFREDERPFCARGNGDHHGQSERIYKMKPDKQRGHSRRHDGFNDRWDKMEKAEQCSEMRNKRDVWTVAPANYPDAHFATYPPDLIKPCILAGTRPAGKRCDCAEIIRTPTGRTGMNRPRRDGEGSRPITKREQRSDAAQLTASPHRVEIAAMCGAAFAHYIRTDESGARPLPENIRAELLARGWLTLPAACDCPTLPADIVLDPFAGSGTTGKVALELGRRAVLIELNSDYLKLSDQRCCTTLGLPLAV